MSWHQIVVVGFLGRDPEMRYTPSGSAVTSFSVATTRKWKNQDNSPGEETVWIKVSAWRKLAEVCHQYLAKGRLVLIHGRLTPNEFGNPRTYQRNDGTWAASYEVTAQTVKFLGKTDGQTRGGSGDSNERQRQTQAAQEPPPGFVEENQIPF